ncbi:hypothetical protein ACLB2K_071045 [Fragaria x ananassa]
MWKEEDLESVKFKLLLSPRLGFLRSTEITNRGGYQSTMVESTVQQSRSRDLDKLLLRPGNLIGSNFEPGPGVYVASILYGYFLKSVSLRHRLFLKARTFI